MDNDEIKCDNCFETVLKSAKFCSECGTKLHKEVKAHEHVSARKTDTSSNLECTSAADNLPAKDMQHSDNVNQEKKLPVTLGMVFGGGKPSQPVVKKISTEINVSGASQSVDNTVDPCQGNHSNTKIQSDGQTGNNLHDKNGGGDCGKPPENKSEIHKLGNDENSNLSNDKTMAAEGENRLGKETEMAKGEFTTDATGTEGSCADSKHVANVDNPPQKLLSYAAAVEKGNDTGTKAIGNCNRQANSQYQETTNKIETSKSTDTAVGETISTGESAKASKSGEEKNANIPSKEKGKQEQKKEKKTTDSNINSEPRQGPSAGTRSKAGPHGKVDVHFVVALSKEDFEFSEGDKVHILFEPKELGGFEGKKVWCLSLEREEDDILLFSIHIPSISKHHTGGIAYKYVVIKGDKFLWELRQNDGNRRLSHLEKMNEVWWQYDGIIHNKPKGWKQGLKDIFFGDSKKKMLASTKAAMLMVLPSLEEMFSDNNVSVRGEDFFRKIDQICSCLEQSSFDRNMFEMREVMHAYIKSSAKCLQNKQEKYYPQANDAEAKSRCMATALVMAYLIQKYDLDWELSREITEPLCLTFLPMADRRNKTCPDIDLLTKKHFSDPKLLKTLSMGLKQFLGKMCEERGTFVEKLWLCALPLHHFLEGLSEPYKPAQATDKHRSREWWGISQVNKVSGSFKKKYLGSMPLDEYCEKLGYLFEVDQLLPRSVLAVMSLRDLPAIIDSQLFPADALMANLWFHINAESYYESKYPLTEVLGKLLHFLRNRLDDVGADDDDILLKTMKAQFSVALPISLEFFRQVLHRKSSTKSQDTILTIQISLLCLEIYSKLYQDSTSLQKSKEHLNSVWKNTNDFLIEEYFNTYYLTYSKWKIMRILQTCSELADGWSKNKNIGQEWMQCITDFMRSCLTKMDPKDLLETYCEADENKLHQKIVEALGTEAFSAVEKACQTKGNITSFLDKIGSYNQARARSILSSIFTKTWPSGDTLGDDGVHPVLKHIVEHPAFKNFVQISYGKGQSLFDEDCNLKIVGALSLYQEILTDLIRGSIKFSDMKFLLTEMQQFMDLFKVVASYIDCKKIPESGNKEIGKSEVLLKILHMRKVEFDEFEKKTRLSQWLCYWFNQLQLDVNLHDLSKALEEDIRLMKVSKLWEAMSFNQDGSGYSDTNRPNIFHYPISDDACVMVEEIQRIKNSAIFCNLWEKQGKKMREQSDRHLLTQDDIVKEAWVPVYAQWKKLSEGLETGSITFQDVDKFFGNVMKRPEALQKEMKIIGDGTVWIEVRQTQIEQYCHLDRYMKGAAAIRDFREEFKLKGDFSALETLLAIAGDKRHPLRNIDDRVMQAGRSVEHITDANARAIKTFVKCKAVADWLKINVKESKHLKTLVDLAMATATGHGDMEVQRVTCLHGAAMGYAPLIYELDESIGLTEFLNLCRTVWEAQASDPNLEKKLIDTNANLEWLKQVKESYGSMEVSALTQVEEINKHGVFRVGYFQERREAKQFLSMEDVLEMKLTYRRDGKSKETKTFSFTQLKDLQSKLMLVAGKTKESAQQVETFVEIFDSTSRLADVYLKLHGSGSILFTKWKSTFYCGQRKVNTEVDFGLAELILRGNSDSGNVLHHVQNLCAFMESCYKQWKQHITTARDKHYSLNYFSTKQLVFLRQALAKCQNHVDEQSEEMKQLFALLQSVRPDCSLGELQTAIELASNDVHVPESFEEDCDANRDEEICSVEDEDTEGLFIASMMEAGFSEVLAKRAMEEVGADLVEEGILWCMENDGDEALESRVEATGLPSRQAAVVSEVSHEAVTLELLQRLDSQKKTGDLVDQLESLWQDYLKRVHTSLADCISVEHLGYILERLAYTPNLLTVNRQFPPSLKPGNPNLILCPANEVLSTLLSVYMYDEHKPSPSPEEVLMCTRHTTEEEVELFWRKALGDIHGSRHGRIYSIVNADQLTFAACTMLEVWLHKPQSHSGLNYHMVVICSRAAEERSHVINVLDRYRVSYPKMFSWTDTQLYLRKKLMSTQTRARSGVCMVKSMRSGMGKSLYVQRAKESCKMDVVKVSLHEKTIDVDSFVSDLLPSTQLPWRHNPRLIHIDLAHYVERGVDQVLFTLLVIGSLVDSEGRVLRRNTRDLYMLECVPICHSRQTQQEKTEPRPPYIHSVLALLPSVMCWSPEYSLLLLSDRHRAMQMLNQAWPWLNFDEANDQLMDDRMFRSAMFQRPYQYLSSYDNRRNLTNADTTRPQGDYRQCLHTMIRHCGLRDPSWSELRHFASFLNAQLLDCEESVYCQDIVAEDLPNFRYFVLRFMSHMSRDFATRSLVISEDIPEDMQQTDGRNDMLALQYTMKRRWESSGHPYLFFNPDHHSMTFLGFHINPNSGDVFDPATGEVFERGIAPKNLFDGLVRNRAPLNENFDRMSRSDILVKLCRVMGLEYAHDPDPTYELTMDNVKKILAIYMRFRCGIPVVVMGETGCGKTRLVKFMCDLQAPPGCDVQNMLLIKVHGGTTAKDINSKIEKAAQLAAGNHAEYGQNMHTVLFFDEANTTEAIGVIKEVLCDGTIGSKPVRELANGGLRLIAACNPYRKHTDAMIARLEKAGLGYRVRADQTTDTLGGVPLRRLVYRVHALPQSLIPLVWDFGQLNQETEHLYIKQMVKKACDKEGWNTGLVAVISNVLVESQQYMRQQQNEVSFVSLRDVERALKVMSWFYKQKKLFEMMDERAEEEYKAKYMEDDDGDDDMYDQLRVDEMTRSLILAVGVCYHSCLEERSAYRKRIACRFSPPLRLPSGAQTIEEEIMRCQVVLLNEVDLEENIARNQALLENFFMMVVCIELRIPLFLVGKPGSSKSLAKTIVNDAMQRKQAHSDLFKTFKQVHMVSFQCSQLSTPEGIVSTFRQCAKLQEDKNLDEFVSVVVLDEVGLAEDSPRMPLKTLHPLLEDGCIDDEEQMPHKKVAFIGISNWALDPAKMNRGIFVQRTAPDEKELENTAKNICSDPVVMPSIRQFFRPLAVAYLKVFEEALHKHSDEFFGLRDYYSLVKMIFGFAKKHSSTPSWRQLQHAILRNFGGLEKIDPVQIFESELKKCIDTTERGRRLDDPDSSSAGLIRASLLGDGLESERRYLLVLTENYSALGILQQELREEEAIVIFGSSFPRDQEYTQVCRNIHRIKVCMEAGRTVVLLNLENLYESLYDALNQYYVYLGGERFVDLGLGNQRVKCAVHKEFRLVVVAEKDVVYRQFPTPLINRLEKHLLSATTLLTPTQTDVVQHLKDWVQLFISLKLPGQNSRPKSRDVFIGYHADTLASVVLQVCDENPAWSHIEDKSLPPEEMIKKSKEKLLQTATPESLVRLKQANVSEEEARWLNQVYSKEQAHESLEHFLLKNISAENDLFAKVSTHGRLLSEDGIKGIRRRLAGLIVCLDHLQKYDTEQQFCKQMRSYMKQDHSRLLILQCDAGEHNAKLVACAQHHVRDIYQDLMSQTQHNTHRCHVVFVVQLPRLSSTTNYLGFQGGTWMTYHIDELQSSEKNLPPLLLLQTKPLSAVLEASLMKSAQQSLQENDELNMEVDEAAEYQPEDRMEVSEQDDSYEPTDILRQMKDTNKDEEELEMYLRGDKVMDVDALLNGCLHEAVAMIQDPDGWPSRKKHRISLLIDVLHHVQTMNSADNLSHATKSRVVLLLKSKETERMSADMVQNWLLYEVASVKAVTEAGTFRRSLVHCLEQKLTPILAGLLAYLDTNCNLDLLQHVTATETWIFDLWVKMFTNADFTKFNFSDLSQSMKKGHEREEMLVNMASPQPMKPEMPFSWVIRQLIDDLLHQAMETNEEDILEHVANILSSSTLGAVMKDLSDVQLRSAVQFYLHDYVLMMHKHHTRHITESVEVVCKAIEQYATGLRQDLQPDFEPNHAVLRDAFLELLSFHLAYKDLQKTLLLLNDAAQIEPSIILKLAAFSQNNPGHPLNTASEMVLGIKIVFNILEHLVPGKNHLNEASSRTEWCSRVELFENILDSLFECMGTGLEENERVAKFHEECRSKWSRVRVVYLFVRIVCGQSADHKLAVTKCMPLWNMLDDNTNFKKERYFRCVENFLKTCNRTAVQQCYKLGKTCPTCENDMLSPVTLPCKHSSCENCIKEWQDLNQYCCPQCKQPYEKDYKPTKTKAEQEAHERYQQYRKQCNTFFMEFVSRLCFSGDEPPEVSVMARLLGFVTAKPRKGSQQAILTKQLSVHDNESIDRTPVVRSFLLQLLLQYRLDTVVDLLDQYFKETQFVAPDDRHHIIELCVLCSHCLQDYFDRRIATENSTAEKVAVVQQLLSDGLEYFNEGNSIPCNDLVIAVAQTRCALSIVSMWVDALLNDRDILKQVNHQNLKHLLTYAQRVCDIEQVSGLRVYLMRQIVKKYSLDLLKQTASSPLLKWIVPEILLARDANVSPDHLVVYGEKYIRLREAFAEVALGEDVEKTLLPILETELICHLASYREITSSYADEKAVPQRRVLDNIEECLNNCQIIVNKECASSLVRNTLGGGLMRVCAGSKNKTLTDLLIHLHLVINGFPNAPHFLSPLINMAGNPEQMQGLMLPTMPQDETAEIQQVLMGNRHPDDQKPVLLQCPKGHPYYIGNCGGAVVQEKCPSCGQPIGGINYTLAPGNVELGSNDRTQPGHILGPAERRNGDPTQERSLSVSSTTVTRMLLHLVMYLGTNKNPHAMTRIINPAIGADQVQWFLEGHLVRDLQLLMKCTSTNLDDASLLMHLVIQRLHSIPVGGDGQVMVLNSKQARTNWEQAFQQVFLGPLFNNLKNTITETNKLISSDTRLGNSPLLRMLYEVEQDEECTGDILQAPSLWVFRAPLTLQVIRQRVNEGQAKDQLQLLQLFLDNVHILENMKYLPDIINLQKSLCQHFNMKIESTQAEHITINDFLQSLDSAGSQNELKTWIATFIKAWSVLRHNLKGFTISGGRLRVNEEWCNEEITERSPIVLLLPSSRTRGRISLALVHFLVQVHNDFMENYARLMHQKMDVNVAVEDAGKNQLISFSRMEELQPLILANCSYSYTSTTRTTSHTDLLSLQNAIVQRYVKNRPRLKAKMTEVVFREDLTDAKFFDQLKANITQTELPARDREQIEKEFSDLPDLCEALAAVHVSMGYLVAMPGLGQRTMEDFMTDTLRMDHNLRGKKAGACTLDQVCSLWLTLVMAKSRILAMHQQNAFSGIEGLEEIPPQMKTEIQRYANRAKITELDALLRAMFSFIVFELTTADAESMLNHPINDIMCDAISDERIPELPAGLLVKHMCAVWQQLVIELHKAVIKMEEK